MAEMGPTFPQMKEKVQPVMRETGGKRNRLRERWVSCTIYLAFESLPESIHVVCFLSARGALYFLSGPPREGRVS